MKFEIINPSDKGYIEGEFKVCCIATLLFGEGYYGLEQVDGELKMPIFFLGGCDEWFQAEFGKTAQELHDSLSTEELSAALASVHLAGERSSMNDFTAHAHRLAESRLKRKEATENECGAIERAG